MAISSHTFVTPRSVPWHLVAAPAVLSGDEPVRWRGQTFSGGHILGPHVLAAVLR